MNAVSDWNRKHEVGTPVKVRRDNGEVLETVTRSEAWHLDSGVAVIMVKGISGCYRLDRITPNTASTGKLPAASLEGPLRKESHK